MEGHNEFALVNNVLNQITVIIALGLKVSYYSQNNLKTQKPTEINSN